MSERPTTPTVEKIHAPELEDDYRQDAALVAAVYDEAVLAGRFIDEAFIDDLSAKRLAHAGQYGSVPGPGASLESSRRIVSELLAVCEEVTETGELIGSRHIEASCAKFVRVREAGVRGQFVVKRPMTGEHMDVVDYDEEIARRQAAGIAPHELWTVPLSVEVEN